ncbi:UDP-N-acetyl-D-glucosamine 6-dehydrogenase [subsurface metagenome]
MQLLERKLKERKAKIAVIGLGYVGLPLAVEQAKAGFTVVGIERKKKRVDMVNQGKNYIPDVINFELERAVKEGKLRVTQDFGVISKVDVICICVPTPLTKNKEPDVQYIQGVTDKLTPYLHKGQLIVLESTTYPGTTEEVILPGLQRKGLKVGEDFYLAYSPERIDPGNKKYRMNNISKVIGGITKRCTHLARILYEQTVKEKVFPVSSPGVAEMEKLLENVFRNVNIALVNEMTLLCNRMGINIWEVIEAAKTKPYGFMPFYPGPGLGGHCIPIDPFYLAWRAKEYDFNTRFIELAAEINNRMPHYVVDRLSKVLNEHKRCLNGARVLILGAAYKRNIGDVRESPVLKIIKLLEEEKADVCYHDPYVPSFFFQNRRYESVKLTKGAIKSADLVLITTDHDFYQYEEIVEQAKLIFDTRNATKNVTRGRNKIHLL